MHQYCTCTRFYRSLGDWRVREYFKVKHTQFNTRVVRTEKKEDGGVSLAKMSNTGRSWKMRSLCASYEHYL